MSRARSSFSKFKNQKRQAVRLSQESLVTTGYLEEIGEGLPLVIRPNAENLNLVSWAESNRDFLDRELAKHGGILFRGFEIPTVEKFEEFIDKTQGGSLKYTERSSPRSQVKGNVYTSTDHPADQEIYLHNEQSYNITFPQRIAFFCVTPSETGGETPIADCRQVYRELPAEVRDRFVEQGYMYVRNFGDGFGLSWQVAFQTDDPARVEAYCREHEIEYEWRDGDHLRTRQVRRVAAKHPRSGEVSWFNHLTFFHVSTLEPKLRQTLIDEFGEENLPNNTYYGDGSPVEDEVMDVLHDAYRRATLAFPWQKNDLLLLDNMLTAHGRRPFTGQRKVVVGMAEPHHWTEV